MCKYSWYNFNFATETFSRRVNEIIRKLSSFFFESASVRLLCKCCVKENREGEFSLVFSLNFSSSHVIRGMPRLLHNFSLHASEKMNLFKVIFLLFFLSLANNCTREYMTMNLTLSFFSTSPSIFVCFRGFCDVFFIIIFLKINNYVNLMQSKEIN